MTRLSTGGNSHHHILLFDARLHQSCLQCSHQGIVVQTCKPIRVRPTVWKLQHHMKQFAIVRMCAVFCLQCCSVLQGQVQACMNTHSQLHKHVTTYVCTYIHTNTTSLTHTCTITHTHTSIRT